MSPVLTLLGLGAGAGLLFFLSKNAGASSRDNPDLPADLMLGWKQSVLESARTGTSVLMVQTAEIARQRGLRVASDEMFQIAENFQNSSDGAKVALSAAVNGQNVGAVSSVAETAESNGERRFASFARIVARFLAEMLRGQA